jgi:hypothetical protein
LLGQLEPYDLDLPAGTVNDGLKPIDPRLQPIYEALLKRHRQLPLGISLGGTGAVSVRRVGTQSHVARYRRRRICRRCARTSISNTSESSVSDILVAGFAQIEQVEDSSGNETNSSTMGR